MPIEILPAVLAKNPVSLKNQIERVAAISKTLHLDLMDGQFVKARSLNPRQLASVLPRRPVEVHGMLRNWQPWLEVLGRLTLRRVVLHVELGERLLPWMAWWRSRRVAVTLAINPATRSDRLARWIPHVSGLQVMMVQPGQFGSAFLSRQLLRLTWLRRKYPKLKLAADGGITEATIAAVVRAGAQQLVVGSRLQRATDPAGVYQAMRRIAQKAANVIH